MKFFLNYPVLRNPNSNSDVFVYVQKDSCGVNYYTDWRNTKFGGRRIFAVPDTCCKTNEFGCGFKFETDDINRRGSFVLLIVV